MQIRQVDYQFSSMRSKICQTVRQVRAYCSSGICWDRQCMSHMDLGKRSTQLYRGYHISRICTIQHKYYRTGMGSWRSHHSMMCKCCRCPRHKSCNGHRKVGKRKLLYESLVDNSHCICPHGESGNHPSTSCSSSNSQVNHQCKSSTADCR